MSPRRGLTGNIYLHYVRQRGRERERERESGREREGEGVAVKAETNCLLSSNRVNDVATARRRLFTFLFPRPSCRAREMAHKRSLSAERGT